MRRGPGCAEAEALGEVVEAERVGKWGAVAAGDRGVVGLDDLVDDPAHDEEAEDIAAVVGERGEDGEDDQVDEALGVLAVVHGADAGDEAEQGGQAGVGFAGNLGARGGGIRRLARGGYARERRCGR